MITQATTIRRRPRSVTRRQLKFNSTIDPDQSLDDNSYRLDDRAGSVGYSSMTQIRSNNHSSAKFGNTAQQFGAQFDNDDSTAIKVNY